MNRFSIVAWLAVCGLVAVATLTGCGTGQLSQTASMEPAVNGTSATVKNIALRDVRIRAVQTSDEVRPGSTVELVLVITNQSPDVNDKLQSITTDIGQVTLAGNTAIPANGALVVGTPDRLEATALQAVEPTNTTKATVTLNKPISNGLTYDFTFRFAQAGETTFPVPIAAGTDAPRQLQAPQGEPH